MDESVSVGPALAWAGEVMRQWRQWMRAHLGLTILLSIVAFGFGWVWNTYVMAVNLDGVNPAPGEQTIATASGRPLNSLFWLLFFCLLSGLVAYGFQRGWGHLFADLAVLPRKLGQTLSRHTGGAFSLLLWGMSVSLIISTVVSSAVSLALGLVLLTLAATPIGTILNFVLIRLWKGLAGIVQPSAGLGAVLVSGPFLVMVGEAAGLLADWLFGLWFLSLGLGVAAAVASVLLARKANPTSPGTATFVLLGLAALTATAWPGRARADDGGWQECFDPATGEPCSEMGLAGIFAWFGSDGAGAVIANGAVGGVFAGVGAAVGVGLGSVAASLSMAAAAAAASGASGPRAPHQTSGPTHHDQPPPTDQLPTHHDQPPGHQPDHQSEPRQDRQPGRSIPGDHVPGHGGGDPTVPIQQPGHIGSGHIEAGHIEAGHIEAGHIEAGPGDATQPLHNVPQQPPPPPVEDYLPDAQRRDRRGDDPNDPNDSNNSDDPRSA